MSQPTSDRRLPAVETLESSLPATRRRGARRALFAATGLIAFLLLAVAVAAEGQPAVLILAAWAGVLVVAGLRLSALVPVSGGKPLRATRRLRAARRPVLILAELNERGELGASRTLPIVDSDAAIAVLDARPRG